MNNNNDLKSKSLHGIFWSFIQKFGLLFISFLTNLILVRYLSPSDFGVFGIILIFVSFADTFIDSGFGSALIQKKNVSPLEYSSVFFLNFAISLLFFALLYLSSDMIANYFKNDELSILIKIQSTVIIFNGLSVVQSNILQKHLKFKKLAMLSTSVTVLANILAVLLAYYKFGALSLVIRNVLISFGILLMYWFFSNWKPIRKFSFISLKGLFSFGGYMFLSSFIEKIYSNLQSILIGKYFSVVQLGFYSQATRLQELPANTISQVINQVTFPLYSSINDDKLRLKEIFRKNYQVLTFIVFPFFMILFFVSRELILLLYGKNWIPSIFYFKFLCLYGISIPINIMHTNIIKSLGNGRLYFFQQLFKRVIGIILIICSVFYGLEAIMVSVIISGYIFLIINSYITSNNIDYSIKHQVKDMLISFTPNIIPIVFLLFFSFSFSSELINIISIGIIYMILFLFSCFMFKNPNIKILYNFIKK